MKIRSYLFSIFLFISISCYSQIAIRHQISTPRLADSIDIEYYSHKNGLRAGAMNFSLNMGIWAFDRYIQKADFAYISIHTIKDNLKHGFVWDNDQMGTNMFLHPYHGSLYYNSARSNGYGYWASGAFALGGSAMWELFLENEYPSINDITATPIGGMAIGEVLYRSSDLILDDRTRGKARFGRELAAFIVAPTRGLTRILNGDAWAKRTTSGKQFGVPDVSIDISSGLRILELRDKIFDTGMGAAFTINVEYGDRYGTEEADPYDFFTFRTNLDIQSSQPVLSQLNIIGKLHATDLIDTEKDFLSIGAYQHFDYYDSDTISSVSNKVPYKFCTPASLGIGFIYQNKRYRDWDLNAFTHINGIILGGALSDYYVVDMRNYNLASGFSWKAGFNIAYKDLLSVSTDYEAYKMFTWKGYPEGFNDWDNIDVHNFNYQGDHSQAILHAVSIKADLKLRKQIYFTGIFTEYSRKTNYKYMDEVRSTTSEGRIMLTYKF